jgi:hypothetical protein
LVVGEGAAPSRHAYKSQYPINAATGEAKSRQKHMRVQRRDGLTLRSKRNFLTCESTASFRRIVGTSEVIPRSKCAKLSRNGVWRKRLKNLEKLAPEVRLELVTLGLTGFISNPRVVAQSSQPASALITSVRTYFRGFCLTGLAWEAKADPLRTTFARQARFVFTGLFFVIAC